MQLSNVAHIDKVKPKARDPRYGTVKELFDHFNRKRKIGAENRPDDSARVNCNEFEYPALSGLPRPSGSLGDGLGALIGPGVSKICVVSPIGLSE